MPQIYTTGAFVSPEKRIVDGHEEWFWKVDRFEEDSFHNGEQCNPIEISTNKADLLHDNLRQAKGQ